MKKTIFVQTGLNRKVEIVVGKEYVIEPLNPRKLKNRGREVMVLDFVPQSESHPNDIVAKVRYLDNNRVGRADLGDLRPLLDEN